MTIGTAKSEKGLPLNREYFSTLLINGEEISHGEGRTKKSAETAAAIKALDALADAVPKTKKPRKRR